MRWRVLFALSLVGCSAVLGIDDLEIGACKGSRLCLPDASTDDQFTPPEKTDATVDASACPSSRGPEMIRIDGGCVDTTEVTIGEYRPFFAEKGTDPTGQPTGCEWNDSYLPTNAGADELPQTGVDWCDAFAFCKWAGKKLCAPSLWLAACTKDGTLTYPYGSIEQRGTCNVTEADAAPEAAAPVLLNVKAKSACTGGYAGLYDMLGNAAEWTDNTFAPHDAGPDADAGGRETDDTKISGGAFNTLTPECATLGNAARNRQTTNVGFRCCSP